MFVPNNLILSFCFQALYCFGNEHKDQCEFYLGNYYNRCVSTEIDTDL